MGAGRAQACGEEAVGAGGGAAALHVAENGDAGFELGELFELLGEAHGVADVLAFQGGELLLRDVFLLLCFGGLFLFEGGVEQCRV